MLEKEEAAASKKRKQALMDEILTPSPIKSAESSMEDSQKSLQRCHQRHGRRCTWSPGTLTGPDRVMVGMHVLSQVISASECDWTWSAHGHIQTKIQNKLSPEQLRNLFMFTRIAKWLQLTGLGQPCPVRLTPSDPRNYRILPNRQEAHFDRIANREELPRDSTWFDQHWGEKVTVSISKILLYLSFSLIWGIYCQSQKWQ